MQTGFDRLEDEAFTQDQIIPLEYKVLVRVDKVADQSAGGIFLADQTQEKQQYARDTGRILKMAGNAFSDKTIFAEAPEVGDRVMYDKYAGTIMHMHEEAENGRSERTTLRLLNDKDICAIIK